MEFLSLPNSSAMRTVTILALDVAPDNPDVVDFLTWFPCVEKLHMVLTLEPLYMLLKPDCMHICQNRTLVHILYILCSDPAFSFPVNAPLEDGETGKAQEWEAPCFARMP